MLILTLHLLLLSFFSQSNSLACRSGSLYSGRAEELVQKTNTDAVTLNVTVTDKRGGYIKGLGPGDFTISDGKSNLEISSFSYGDEPMSVGIVYDASLSWGRATHMGSPKVVKEALDGFVRSSNASNSYFLISFSDQPQILVDWTRDRETLLRPVQSIKATGPTALYDACDMALEKLREGDHRKRVLVLISDGLDSRSRRRYSELWRLIRSSEVLLYAIVTPDGGEDLVTEEGRMVLEALSSETGGGAVHPHSASEVIAAAEQLAFELSRQYWISLKRGNLKGDKWRELKIKVTPHPNSPELQDLTVRSRRGYSTERSR